MNKTQVFLPSEISILFSSTSTKTLAYPWASKSEITYFQKGSADLTMMI